MYSCKLCDKSYKWPGDLKRHLRVKHFEEKERLLNNKTNDNTVNKHCSKKESNDWDCPVCGKSFIWPSDLGRHMKIKHSSQPENKREFNITEVQKQDHNMQASQVFHFPEIKQTWMQFCHPATAMLVGPSSSGKTTFLVRFLTHLSEMIDQEIEEIIWCYGIKQDFHKDIKTKFPKIKFIEGFPDYNTFDASKTRICVIDDLMSETKGNIVSDLFSKVSHHSNTSVFYIVQNLFPKNKEQRDISLNSKYFIIFKNPRDNKQVGMLGIQMGKHDLITQAYKHATSEPYGYLLIDVTQGANDLLRVRSKIFPDDEENVVYLPESKSL